MRGRPAGYDVRYARCTYENGKGKGQIEHRFRTEAKRGFRLRVFPEFVTIDVDIMMRIDIRHIYDMCDLHFTSQPILDTKNFSSKVLSSPHPNA